MGFLSSVGKVAEKADKYQHAIFLFRHTMRGIIILPLSYLLIFYIGMPAVKKSMETKSWPHVPGSILKSKVQQAYNRDGILTFRPDIIYEYQIGEINYIGEDIEMGTSNSSSKVESVQKMIAEYPEAEIVKVFYNPLKPEESVLKTGTSWFTLLPMMFGLLIFLPWAWVLISEILFGRKGKKEPDDESRQELP